MEKKALMVWEYEEKYFEFGYDCHDKDLVKRKKNKRLYLIIRQELLDDNIAYMSRYNKKKLIC